VGAAKKPPDVVDAVDGQVGKRLIEDKEALTFRLGHGH
jgi:tetratricopeptide (TPR) repeat protein